MLEILSSLLILFEVAVTFTNDHMEQQETCDRMSCGDEYVEYTHGDVNLIVSIPHGGEVKPEEIPARREGCRVDNVCSFAPPEVPCHKKDICKIISGGDVFTIPIGRLAMERFTNITGRRPYAVIGHLHRSKVDYNRQGEEAAQHSSASSSHAVFHDYIKTARASLSGPGLIIDLHGQRHGLNTTELGYLYRKEDLNSGDYSLPSSIRGLTTRLNIPVKELLYGEDSLGALFERRGYSAVPSPRQPAPGNHQYYRGGFITQTYGSAGGGQVDAIQIEVPSEIRYEGGPDLRQRFGLALGDILAEFYTANYPS